MLGEVIQTMMEKQQQLILAEKEIKYKREQITEMLAVLSGVERVRRN